MKSSQINHKELFSKFSQSYVDFSILLMYSRLTYDREVYDESTDEK